MYFYGNFNKIKRFKKYAWEFTVCQKFRTIEDGITFFDFKIELDSYAGDHSPRFTSNMTILNHTVFEFVIYNRYHFDDPEYNN